MALMFEKANYQGIYFLREIIKKGTGHSVSSPKNDLTNLARLAVLHGFNIGSLKDVRTPAHEKDSHGERLIPVIEKERKNFYDLYCEERKRQNELFSQMTYHLKHAEEGEPISQSFKKKEKDIGSSE